MSKRKHHDALNEDAAHAGLGLGLGLGLNWATISNSGNSASHVIQSSNIGFQLLKKCGWKEGSGLGVAEQGRLEPIETHVKTDKRGIGAEKKPKKMANSAPKDKAQGSQGLPKATTKKSKALNRRLKMLEAEEKQVQEKAFEIEFFREFWPDNV